MKIDRIDPHGIEQAFKNIKYASIDSSVKEDIAFLRRQLFLLAVRAEKRSKHDMDYAAAQQLIEKELDNADRSDGD